MVSPHKHILDIVSDFCALQRPSFSRKIQIQDLVLPYIDVLGESDLKSICSKLSRSENSPVPLVLALCTQPVEICHALLISSPVLGHAEYAEIAESCGLEHARIIARNLAIKPETSLLLRSLGDPRIDRALDLRQRPRYFAEIKDNDIDGVQDTTAIEEIAVKPHDSLHTEQSDDVVYTAISDKLGLSVTSVKIICGDIKSRNLPTTLHFMGLSTQSAWNLYKRLAGSFADRRGVELAFKDKYSMLDRDQTKSVVSAWQLEELSTLARFGDVANKPDTVVAPASKSA